MPNKYIRSSGGFINVLFLLLALVLVGSVVVVVKYRDLQSNIDKHYAYANTDVLASAIKGTVTGTITVDPTSDLRYGGWVSFITSMGGNINRKSYNIIRAHCVNQNGLWVYSLNWYDQGPEYKFPLSSQDGLTAEGSPWNGESAFCTANLEHWYPNGISGTPSTLATTTFNVQAKQ